MASKWPATKCNWLNVKYEKNSLKEKKQAKILWQVVVTNVPGLALSNLCQFEVKLSMVFSGDLLSSGLVVGANPRKMW